MIDNTIVSTHLGKTSEYKSQYDPSLLVREPRQSNRVHLNISDDNLPFIGTDTWNAYEISGLTNNGAPVTGVAKIVYPCTNKYIVESKSLKLYFNSFNMTKLGETAYDVQQAIERRASEDLSKLLETDVLVTIFNVSKGGLSFQRSPRKTWWDDDVGPSKFYSIPVEYQTLEDTVSLTDLTVDKYTECADLLQVDTTGKESVEEEFLHSSLLKSNCRVTSQPDFGDVFIYVKYNEKKLSSESLLKYIISFRDECHFHEEICETIYTRLWNFLEPKELAVKCLYTRRGGIDICPERVSNENLAHWELSTVTLMHTKTPRQ